MPCADKFGYLDTAAETFTAGGADSGARLFGVVVGDGVASAVVTVYSGITAVAGNTIAVIDASSDREVQFHGLYLSDGLHVVLSGGNAKVTVLAG